MGLKIEERSRHKEGNMKSMTIVRAKWIRGLDHVIDAVIVIALLAVTALMFVQVVMRYVLRSPLMASKSLTTFQRHGCT